MSEHAEQVAVIYWCFHNTANHPELDLIFAIPNGAMLGGGRIGAIRMHALKAEGLRPGVSDLFLPAAHKGFHGLFIELKTHKGTPSDNQLEFIANVSKQGYYAIVCYGASEAIDILEWYVGKDS